ncbi:phage gp29-like protein [Rhizobium subbaraonis]|uniref:Phage gp29-like protein n=1 Tax=Rhizobium subbaraonis TaxID=908946 RepID=A0A285UXY1_9HYPH|nr:DUF935 domain-containing protein [Rhizobium subbaraonis]SOC46643.1 phage gp29-like protein [Rhizobium subbaraonis]
MAQILDQWGNPVSTAKLKQEQAAPTLTSVRRPNMDHQASGLTPQKLARLLRSSLQGDPEGYLELAEDMEERDLHYAGVLGARKLQVAGLEITVEAASDAAADIDNADMVRAFLQRDAFESEMVDILDAIGKGFSCTEIIWDSSEGQHEPRELKWRDPRWFTFDDLTGEIPLLREAGEHQPLVPFKWIFHQAKVKSGLPIRGGIARAVCWTFLFKSFTAKDWAIFCEAYGQPLRLGKYGPGATEGDKEILAQAVANIGADYSAIVPLNMAVEFIKADLAGSHDLYEKRSDWLDRQVSKVVLGQTGTTDAIAGGYAVGKVHNSTKDDIERSDAKQLGATLARDLARPYIDLNRGPQKAYPRIRIGRPETVDTDKWMSNVKTFVSMGGKVGMSVVRDRLSIPDPDEDEELLGAPAKPAQDKDQPPVDPKDKTALQLAGTSTGRDAIDQATAAALDDDAWEPLVAPMIEGLEEKIAAAGSVEEARRVLADHFRAMDADALAEQLARLAFNARLAGEYGEDLS